MARNEGSLFRLIVILMVTLLCLGISFVQMTIGYQEFGGIWLSGVLSFAVSLILFYLIFELYRTRREGKPVTRIMSWYLFFVVLSFAAHFTSFYTLFMRNELLRAELNDKYSALKLLKEDAGIIFLSTKGDPKVLADNLSQLKTQILSDSEPGCGKKCNYILANINKERKKAGYYDLQVLKARSLIDSKGNQITGDDKKKILTADYNDYYCQVIGLRECKLQDDLENDLVTLEPKGEVIDYPSNWALDHIRKMVQRFNDRASSVREFALGKYSGPTKLSVENDELGKIKQTFASAVDHRLHWGTWVSALAALLVDLLAPIFVIGFIGSGGGPTPSFVRRRGGAANLS